MHEIWSKNAVEMASAGYGRIPTQWLGAFTSRDGERRIAIRPEAVRDWLSRAGYELLAIQGRWVADGYVSTSVERKTGKVRPRQKVRIGQGSAWLLEFTAAGFPLEETDTTE
jgi:hypothetical protein